MDAHIDAQVTSKVRAFVTTSLDYESPDAQNIFQSLLVSSLFGMQLITFIEKSFELKVTEEDLVMDNFNSIENISRFVSRKRDPK